MPHTKLSLTYGYDQQQIIRTYNIRRTQHITRIRQLPDHVYITDPDGGVYLGQTTYRWYKYGQGIYNYSSGDVYFGSWLDGKFYGQGVYIFKGGDIYDGMMQAGIRYGKGIYYYDSVNAYYSGNWHNNLKNGIGLWSSKYEYYEGDWVDGVKDGSGYCSNSITYDSYVGYFSRGLRHGKGRLVFGDGSVYSGYFKDDLPDGVGDLYYTNKDKYIGSFSRGMKHGKGNYHFSYGTIFKGKWNQDNKVYGELVLFNGDYFVGTFKDNYRSNGIYKYRNKDEYYGTWLHDLKDGYGKLSLFSLADADADNYESYEGYFVKGQKHGQGRYIWKTGDQYTGYFSYDKRYGKGLYYWNDGGFFKGLWSADRMNGFGRLCKNGIDIMGYFFADHFVPPVEEDNEIDTYLLSYIRS